MVARIDDPTLLDRILRQFRIKGRIAPFDLSNVAVPVFDIGELTKTPDPTVVTTLAGSQGVRIGLGGSADTYLHTNPQGFNDGDWTNSGAVVNPAAAAVIVDSGARGAGLRVWYFLMNWNAAILDFQIEWRNAANSATLATFGFQLGTGLPHVQFGPITLNMAASERMRVVTASGGTGTADATVGFSSAITPSVAS